MPKLDWDPDRFRQSCLLHYLLCCGSAIQFTDQRCSWTGDLDNGSFHYDNGCGDQFVVVWQADQLIALTFDHESDRSPYVEDEVDWSDAERLCRRWLGELPAELEALFEQASQRIEAVTAAMWGTAAGLAVGHAFEACEQHGLWMFQQHRLPHHEALFGGLNPWIEEMSIATEQGEVAVKLLEQARHLPYTLSDEDIRKLLIVGCPVEDFPIAGVAQAQAMLKVAGYHWG